MLMLMTLTYACITGIELPNSIVSEKMYRKYSLLKNANIQIVNTYVKLKIGLLIMWQYNNMGMKTM